jgi:hypothetical protein
MVLSIFGTMQCFKRNLILCNIHAMIPIQRKSSYVSMDSDRKKVHARLSGIVVWTNGLIMSVMAIMKD